MQEFIKLKSSRLKTILPLGIVVLVGFGAFSFWYHLGDNRGYAPEQPVPFSHKLHAGDFKIDCQYCHAGVDKSRHATIPSMNVCLNCHSVVGGDKPNIQKMKELAKQGDSFEWIRVHDLPDFVFFNHKRHIAKGVACEKCHGDVKTMEKVVQQEKFNMAFCVNCHRNNPQDPKLKASINCNTCHH